MEKLALIIDSTVYLTNEEIKKYGIKKVSLNIIDGEESFKEADVDSDYVYNRLDKGHILTTSQPSPAEFLDAYKEFINQGYEKIFVICISKEISGTFQSATIAKKMMDNPDIIHVFDSNLAAFGNEMIALRVVEMIKDKKSSDFIIEKTQRLIKTSNLVFTLGTLESLIRSGRLSKAKAIFGTVLRIKPLIQMIDGKLDLFKSARTHKKVIGELIERIKETTVEFSSICIRILSHNQTEEAMALKLELERVFNNIKISYTENLGPIFCLHLGKRGYGLSWCEE